VHFSTFILVLLLGFSLNNCKFFVCSWPVCLVPGNFDTAKVNILIHRVSESNNESHFDISASSSVSLEVPANRTSHRKPLNSDNFCLHCFQLVAPVFLSLLAARFSPLSFLFLRLCRLQCL